MYFDVYFYAEAGGIRWYDFLLFASLPAQDCFDCQVFPLMTSDEVGQLLGGN